MKETDPDARHRVAARWLPGGGLTYDEWHAALLGLIAIIPGLMYAEVHGLLGITVVLVLISVAFGLRITPTDQHAIAGRVVRHEPWYFTTVSVVAFITVVLVL